MSVFYMSPIFPQVVEDPQPKCDVTPEFIKVHAKVRANINTMS